MRRTVGLRRGGQSLDVELAVVAAIAVIAGVVLRFVAPTPLWLDEALSVHIASLEPSELVEALRNDGHPPLYYLLLHYWMQIFGEGDTAVRALSGVISVATVGLGALAGRRLGGPAGAAVAAALLAASPYVLRYGSESRMYALVMLLVMAGWLLVRGVIDGGGLRWRLPALVVISGAGMLTHYWTFYLVAVVGGLLVLMAWRSPPARTNALAAAGALAGGGVLFLAWLPSFLDQLGATGTPWAPPVRPFAALGVTLVDMAGGSPNESLVGVAILGVVVVLALMAVSTGDDRRIELRLTTVAGVRGEALVFFGVLMLGVAVGWLTDSTFVPRYASTVVPLGLLVVTAGILVVSHRVARAVLLCAVLAAGIVGTARTLTTERTQAGAVAEAMAEHVSSGDVVVMCPDQLGPATTRAIDKRFGDLELDQYVYPTMAGPERVDWTDYAERNAAADPEAFAEQLLGATPPEASIFLVWDTTYRTLEDQCEALVNALGRARPGVTVMAADGDRYNEQANLTWFGPQ